MPPPLGIANLIQMDGILKRISQDVTILLERSNEHSEQIKELYTQLNDNASKAELHAAVATLSNSIMKGKLAASQDIRQLMDGMDKKRFKGVFSCYDVKDNATAAEPSLSVEKGRRDSFGGSQNYNKVIAELLSFKADTEQKMEIISTQNEQIIKLENDIINLNDMIKNLNEDFSVVLAQMEESMGLAGDGDGEYNEFNEEEEFLAEGNEEEEDEFYDNNEDAPENTTRSTIMTSYHKNPPLIMTDELEELEVSEAQSAEETVMMSSRELPADAPIAIEQNVPTVSMDLRKSEVHKQMHPKHDRPSRMSARIRQEAPALSPHVEVNEERSVHQVAEEVSQHPTEDVNHVIRENMVGTSFFTTSEEGGVEVVNKFGVEMNMLKIPIQKSHSSEESAAAAATVNPTPTSSKSVTPRLSQKTPPSRASVVSTQSAKVAPSRPSNVSSTASNRLSQLRKNITQRQSTISSNIEAANVSLAKSEGVSKRHTLASTPSTNAATPGNITAVSASVPSVPLEQFENLSRTVSDLSSKLNELNEVVRLNALQKHEEWKEFESTVKGKVSDFEMILSDLNTKSNSEFPRISSLHDAMMVLGEEHTSLLGNQKTLQSSMKTLETTIYSLFGKTVSVVDSCIKKLDGLEDAVTKVTLFEAIIDQMRKEVSLFVEDQNIKNFNFDRLIQNCRDGIKQIGDNRQLEQENYEANPLVARFEHLSHSHRPLSSAANRQVLTSSQLAEQVLGSANTALQDVRDEEMLSLMRQVKLYESEMRHIKDSYVTHIESVKKMMNGQPASTPTPSYPAPLLITTTSSSTNQANQPEVHPQSMAVHSVVLKTRKDEGEVKGEVESLRSEIEQLKAMVLTSFRSQSPTSHVNEKTYKLSPRSRARSAGNPNYTKTNMELADFQGDMKMVTSSARDEMRAKTAPFNRSSRVSSSQGKKRVQFKESSMNMIKGDDDDSSRGEGTYGLVQYDIRPPTIPMKNKIPSSRQQQQVAISQRKPHSPQSQKKNPSRPIPRGIGEQNMSQDMDDNLFATGSLHSAGNLTGEEGDGKDFSMTWFRKFKDYNNNTIDQVYEKKKEDGDPHVIKVREKGWNLEEQSVDEDVIEKTLLDSLDYNRGKEKHYVNIIVESGGIWHNPALFTAETSEVIGGSSIIEEGIEIDGNQDQRRDRVFSVLSDLTGNI